VGVLTGVRCCCRCGFCPGGWIGEAADRWRREPGETGGFVVVGGEVAVPVGVGHENRERAIRGCLGFASDRGSAMLRRRAFGAERDFLGVRLAADSGVCRGELSVLGYGDLDGRVLTIERGLSHGVLGSTRSSGSRRLTLGASTAGLIDSHFSRWERLGSPPVSDWLFAACLLRKTYLSADGLTHRFRCLGRAGGVADPAFHRFRHGVATCLVG